MSRFSFKTLALTAAALCAPAVAQATCANGTCEMYFGQSDEFGNNKFGLDYAIGLGVQGTSAALVASFAAVVEATLFSEEVTIIDVRGAVSALNGTGAAATWAAVLGSVIDLPGLDLAEIELFGIEKTFFSAQATYYASGIPVTVKGEVTGALGATANVDFANGVTMGITPNINLSAEASASVGVACVKAGISGELELINVDVPTSMSLLSNQCAGTQIALNSDVEMSTMDGKIKVFAKACGLNWSKKLIDWDGVDLGSVSLASAAVCI